MATTATAPERKVSAAEAREVAEAAREQEWAAPSFVRDLFLGKFRLDLIHPYPEQDPEEVRRAQPFLEKLERLLREQVDSDRIDREGEIPDAVIQGLRDLGAFGIKIPREYGGLGLSQLSYMKAIELVSSIDGSITALVSAHQSIGVPQPLKLFGTETQKKKYLPRLAKGAISAFALTEPGVGSDPAAMETTAVPTPDGQAWILNGEKLWCTNGTKAELLVVIARTPSKVVNGKEKRQITAFIVETAWPGVKVEHRCHFMGLGDLQRRDALHQRPRPRRERAVGGGQGLEAGPDHSQSRAAHAPHLLGRRRQALPRDLPPVGERTSAVGSSHRQARRDRPEDRRHGGEHVRHGSGGRAVRRDGGPRRLRHPSRGRDRQAVQLRGWMAHHRRHRADPGRPRLRDRRLASGPGREARAGRAHHARLPHQPDFRRIERDHAPVHRPRGGGQAPAGGGRRRDAGEDARRAPARAGARGPVLPVVVSVPLARLGVLAQVHRLRAAREAPALRGAGRAAPGARGVPRDDALRAQARVPPGRAVPTGGRGRRAVRHGRDVRAGRGAPEERPRGRPARRGPRGLVLPPGTRARRREVSRALAQRRHADLSAGPRSAAERASVARAWDGRAIGPPNLR